MFVNGRKFVHYTIKKWTYDRFREAREKKEHVETEDLRMWALQASMQYTDSSFQFIASITWLNRFKKEFRISQRRVTKYVKQTEAQITRRNPTFN